MGEKFNYYTFLTKYKEEQGKQILTESTVGEDLTNVKEGFYGENSLGRLAKSLGYTDIDYFFDDNPGGIEAITQWIESIPEFRKKLSNEYSTEELQNLGIYGFDGYDREEDEAMYGSKLVTHRVIKEEPLQYKIVVNVESRPGVDYAYTVEAGSEDEALAQLKDKIGEITYSVKSIKGFQVAPDLPVEPVGTIDGKKVDMGTVQLDGVDDRDYPDFTDTFIATANFKDGTELTDDQLNRLQDQHADQLHQWAYESLFEGLTPKEKVLKEAVIKLIVSEGLEGYSNDALADMIVNLSRYEGNEEDIKDVKRELAKRKGVSEDTKPDKDLIKDFILANHPNSNSLNPEQIELITMQHLDEWEYSREKYTSIGEYLEEVKEDGDFYSGNDYSKEFDSMFGDPLSSMDFLGEKNKPVRGKI